MVCQLTKLEAALPPWPYLRQVGATSRTPKPVLNASRVHLGLLMMLPPPDIKSPKKKVC